MSKSIIFNVVNTLQVKAEIFSYKELIGTADLQIGDESMGHLYGEFIPADLYFLLAQDAFHKFWEKEGDYLGRLKELRINVRLSNGYYLFAAGGVTIDDLIDLPDVPLRIDIAGVERHVIEDYFLREQTHLFVDSPWIDISIEQKLFFEDELKKRLDAFEILEASALCMDESSYDVLFAVKTKSDIQFSIVKLPIGTGDKTSRQVAVYNSWDEFKYERMYPDKRSWDE